MATQRKETGHKQHEIYMPNANPTLVYPMQIIFHWLMLGVMLGQRCFVGDVVRWVYIEF